MPRCCDIKSLPLRKQIIAYTSLSYGVCLLVAMIGFIGIFVGTNAAITNSANNALFDQVQRGASKVMDGVSLWFSEQLNIGRESFTNPFLHGMSDTYRSDYSQTSVTSYFVYGDAFLSPPLTQDSRQTKPVSLENSAYYLPGSVPADIPNFSEFTKTARDQGAHVDTFFRELYANNADFVAAYLGFDGDGQFRHYPGTGTLDTDPGRSYDPRLRGWFQAAITDPNKFIYTSPYRDFNGKGWMITLSGVIRNITDNNIVGVAGSDMLIETVKNNIQSVKFLNTGKISLFEDSGIVVVDQEWDMDKNDTIGKSYADLVNPPVSSSMWAQIKYASPGQSIAVNDPNYVITAARLGGFDNKYLLVAFVPKHEILEPMNTIVTDMKNLNLAVSLSLLGAFIVVAIVLIIFIVCTANQITTPLQQIDGNIDTMVKNIGAKEIGNGLQKIDGGLGQEERGLVDNFNRMKDVVQQAHQNQATNTTENPDWQSNPSAPTLETLRRNENNFDLVVEK